MAKYLIKWDAGYGDNFEVHDCANEDEELFAASWSRMVLLACLLAAPDAQGVAFEAMRAAMALAEVHGAPVPHPAQ